MDDRERVIKGLEKCKRYECDDCTEKCASQAPWDCPAYDDFVDCAIAMLKEQEPKTVRSIRTVAQKSYGYCPSCGRGLDSYRDRNSGEHITHFCYNCGQKVKWDD